MRQGDERADEQVLGRETRRGEVIGHRRANSQTRT